MGPERCFSIRISSLPQEGFEEEKSPIADIPTIGGQQPTGGIKVGIPSLNKVVWTEGRDLLKTTTSKTDDEIGSIIGKWLKRSSTKKDGREKLLAMIRAATKAGTLDPVAYVTKSVESEFGPLPRPEKFDAPTWQRNIQAAIKTKDWPQAWGPLPGMKGCLVPPELITDHLTAAVSVRRHAA